jgi:type IV secretory pathway VirB10-like protein
MKRALPYLAVVAVIGCGGATTAFTRTGPTLAAQPDGCDFSVVTASPSGPSTELGKIDIKYAKQTDWIYAESAFKRKVRTHVCQSGGDTVVAHINDNGLYMNATVLTTKAPPLTTPNPAVASTEPEAASPPAESTPAPAPEKSTQALAAATPATKAAATPAGKAAVTPATKAETAKDDNPTKATSGKQRGKKGAGAKKDEDIRGKDGKVDIDKLL